LVDTTEGLQALQIKSGSIFDSDWEMC
jgi:hypothetical protein